MNTIPILPLPVSPALAADLRGRAQAVLRPTATPSSTADVARALRVLFDLASSAETAADALALLHELQVHQVELDLQTQELRESRQDQEAHASEHARIHEQAPSARAELDSLGQVVGLNATAEDYWGSHDAALAKVLGQPFAAHLTDVSRPVWTQLCQSAVAEGVPMSALLGLQIPGRGVRQVCAAVRPHPDRAGWLLDWLAMPSM